jgi:hypothetical protein
MARKPKSLKKGKGSTISPSLDEPIPSITGVHTFYRLIEYFNTRVLSLNNSKFFAGIIMILINVGSKFIPIQFSKSTETYLKQTVSKQLLVFAMAWLGTRDIYTALILMLIFTFLSDYALNEEHWSCLVPEQYRVLHTLVDTNNDGDISAEELAVAKAVIIKAKNEYNIKQRKEAFSKFDILGENDTL